MQKSPFEQKKSRIGGVIVNSPVFLGAGVLKNPLVPELANYLEDVSIIGAITIGSVTPERRDGNTGSLNWPSLVGDYETFKMEGGLHANGMRNLGIVETMDNLPLNPVKPIILSIAGYSTDDYLYALTTVMAHKNISQVKAVEVNCSCPTMGCDPLAYSLDELETLFIEISKLQLTKPLWFKLPPYFTAEYVAELSKRHPLYNFRECPVITETFLFSLQKLLKKYVGIISAIIVSNGLSQVSRDTEINIKKPDGVITSMAGLSGPALKAGNLKTIQFMKSNGLTVDIIGCGGVLTKQDVIDYLNSGAAAVQCSGGPIWGGGISFFENLIK